MEPRLDAEIQTINDALATKITHGTVVNSDVATGAAIDKTKISGTAVTQADTGTVTSTMIANGTIVEADLADSAVTSAKIANGTIVDADVSGTAAIAATKVLGTMPVGGGAGQVLAKTSGTDYATGWVDGTALPASQVKQLVKNMTGSAIPKGSVVYFSGADGTNILISLADADTEATSSKTVGFTESTIANAGTGYVVSEGLIAGIDTAAATAGQSVWLSSTAGGYVFGAPPAKPAHMVYLGLVTRANQNNGEIFVKVQNGYELDELHNVSITSPTNGQGLTYDASTQMWKNATPISALSGLSDVTITSPVSGEKLVYNGTKWVNLASAGSAFTVSDVAPSLTTASEGDAWVNSSNGTMAVCYVDPDGTKLWLQVQANSALEASILARLGQLESSAIALGTYSPNYIINGGMDIWQRGTSYTLGSTGMTGYFVADRWPAYNPTGTGVLSQDTVNVPTGLRYGLRFTSSAANSSCAFYHTIETLETTKFAGKTVTLSVYLSGTPGSTVQVALNHSTTVDAAWTSTFSTAAIQTFTVTATPTRYSFTTTVPSTAKTAQVFINTGTLANTSYVSFTGVQLEAGSTATAFRRNQPNIQAELAACQRYYYRLSGNGSRAYISGMTGTSTFGIFTLSHPVPLRVAALTIDYGGSISVSYSGFGGSTVSSLVASYATTGITSLGATSGTNGGVGAAALLVIDSTGYVGIGAEL